MACPSSFYSVSLFNAVSSTCAFQSNKTSSRSLQPMGSLDETFFPVIDPALFASLASPIEHDVPSMIAEPLVLSDHVSNERKRKAEVFDETEEMVIESLSMLKSRPVIFDKTSSDIKPAQSKTEEIEESRDETPSPPPKRRRTSRSKPARSWNENLQQLRGIIKSTGKMPTFQTKNVHIWRWLDEQSDLFARNRLDRSRVKLLSDLGFDFVKSESKKSPKKNSKKRFPLSSWLHAQRTQKRKGKLPQYRIDMLNKLGFIWEPTRGDQQDSTPCSPCSSESEDFDVQSPSNQSEMSSQAQQREQTWLENFNKLKEFRRRHGHLRVPTDMSAGRDYFDEDEDEF